MKYTRQKYIAIIIGFLSMMNTYGLEKNTSNPISFQSNSETYQMLDNNPSVANIANSKNLNDVNNAVANEYTRPVYNPRTGNTALMMNTIQVNLQPNTNPNTLASKYKIVVKSYFQHLNIVFFAIGNQQDIFAINTQLQQDSGVKSSEIEVLEHINYPM